jgi:hypothetical protein
MTRTVEEAARILMAKLRVVHGHRTMDDDDAGAILAALREARDAALHEAANHLDRIAPYAEDQQTTFNAQGCAREVRLLASSPPPAENAADSCYVCGAAVCGHVALLAERGGAALRNPVRANSEFPPPPTEGGLRGRVEEIVYRTRPDGDMADRAVNEALRAALSEAAAPARDHFAAVAAVAASLPVDPEADARVDALFARQPKPAPARDDRGADLADGACGYCVKAVRNGSEGIIGCSRGIGVECPFDSPRSLHSRAASSSGEAHVFDKRGADALAREVQRLIDRGVIDSRSPAADALLDYVDPGPAESVPSKLASSGEATAPCPDHAPYIGCARCADNACGFCRAEDWETSATLIRCRSCGATWGRCDGSWRVEPDTVPNARRSPAQSGEATALREAARRVLASVGTVDVGSTGVATTVDDDALAALEVALAASPSQPEKEEPGAVPYTGKRTRVRAGRCVCGGELVRFADAPEYRAQCLACKEWRLAAPSQETETRGCLCSRDNGGVPRSGNTFHSATCCDLRGEGIGEATTNDGMRILESLFAQAEATSAPSAAPDTAGCPTCGTCSGGGICQCEDIRCPCWRASPGAGGADEGSAT